MTSKIWRFLAVAVATFLLLPAMTSAQQYPAGRVSATIVKGYDVTTAGYTYVVFGDRNANLAPISRDGVTGVFGPGTPVRQKIKTSASSTSITANTAGQTPFQGLGVGDLIIVQAPSQGATTLGVLVEYERVIVTFTDNANIVVDSALDLSGGYTFYFKKFLSGTGADDAAFSVEGFDAYNIQADVATFNATNITESVECRTSKFGLFNSVETATVFTAVGSHSVEISTHQTQCRVGFKLTGDTGVNTVNVYVIAAR